MAEYIGCRHCDSPQCDGCNLNTLAKMLHGGKFDCLMDNKHSIKPTADVAEVRHGEWEKIRYLEACVNRYQHTCNVCGKSYFDNNANFNYPYCPNCGAKMDGE